MSDLANFFAVCDAATAEPGGSDTDPLADVAGTDDQAPQDQPAPAAALHPAQHLQDAYLASFGLFQQAIQALEHAERTSTIVGYSLRCSLGVDWDALSKSAVGSTVDFFRQSRMDQGATLSADAEFARAFGSTMHDVLAEAREIREIRERKRWSITRERRRQGLDDELPGEEDEKPLEPVRVDLLKLWDSMAVTYADGGISLARRQATDLIVRAWSLRELQFEVKNGKVQIEDRVWSEVRYNGVRELKYDTSRTMVELFGALQVWFDWAGYNFNAKQALWDMGGQTHSINVTLGASYEVARGLVQVRTFKEHWRWTLSQAAAESLRELVATYGSGES